MAEVNDQFSQAQVVTRKPVAGAGMQDQRLGPADPPSFRYRETLAFEWVELMSNFCPSQRLVGNLDSPL